MLILPIADHYYYQEFIASLTQSQDINPNLLAPGGGADSWQKLLLHLDKNKDVNVAESTFGAKQGAYPSIWIGGAGSCTQAHYDGKMFERISPCLNFYCQEIKSVEINHNFLKYESGR